MAEKQRSGGGIQYRFIPNRRETMRALAMANFTGQEFRVIIALMNQTNGYLRDEDDISSTFWQSLTLMPRQSVFKALQRLVGRGVIAKNDNSYRLKPPNEWPRSVFARPKVCRRALRVAADLLGREKGQEHYRWLSDLLKASPTGDTFKGNRHLEGTIQPPTEAKNEKKRQPQGTVRHPEGTVRHPEGTNRSPTGDDFPMPKERESSKESLKKEEGAPASTTEIGIIDNLARLKGWTVDSLEDLIWLREFMTDFPEFALADIKACRDYYSGHGPPRHKGIWKNRLRNWVAKKREFEREDKTGGQQPRKGIRAKPDQGRRRPATRIPGD